LGVFHFSFFGQYVSNPLSISFISNVEAFEEPDRDVNPTDFIESKPMKDDTTDVPKLPIIQNDMSIFFPSAKNTNSNTTVSSTSQSFGSPDSANSPPANSHDFTEIIKAIQNGTITYKIRYNPDDGNITISTSIGNITMNPDNYFALSSANPGDFTYENSTPSPSDFIEGTNFTDHSSNILPPDFTLGIQNYSANDSSGNRSIECSNQDFSSRGCVVAQQLTNLNGSEIAGFGLIDYDDNAIIHALNLLDAKNLEKVLQNLSTEDLISLKERFGIDTLNPIIKKISLDHREEILARLKQ
jgi:hypothetical protein